MYNASYDLLVKDGKTVIANLDVSATDVTATPKNISIIRRPMLDMLYKQLATQAGVTPDKITEAQLLAAFQLVDERPEV